VGNTPASSSSSSPAPAGGARFGAPDSGRTNSLGLSRVELEAILDRLDAEQAAAGGSSPQRVTTRVPFRHNGVVMDVTQAGWAASRINVACRNLSRGGLSFLHSSYLHVGTRCVAHLPHRTLGDVRVAGKIVRCRHVVRHVHEVGVRFDEAVNLRDYVQLDPFSGRSTFENVDPAALKGRVIVINEYELERRLVASLLEGTGMEFVGCEDAKAGVDAAQKGADVILCESEVTPSLQKVVENLRDAGVQAPVIALGTDQTPAYKDALRAAKVDGLITKPFDRTQLLRSLGEVLLAGWRGSSETASDAALVSTLASKSGVADLVEAYVADLRAMSKKIQAAMSTADTPSIQKMVTRIQGSGTSMGFAPITKAAEIALRTLTATGSVQEATPALWTLITMLNRARARE
jgi:CheY-like chemotaxis protein